MDIDFKALAEGFTSVIPFTSKLGMQVEEARQGYVRMVLPFDATNANHVGSLHAGAIFTLLETAAGLALVSALGELAMRVLVTGAKISYSRKIIGKAIVVAEIPPELVERVTMEIAAQGKAFFSYTVRVVDEAGEAAAECTFDYRMKPPAA